MTSTTAPSTGTSRVGTKGVARADREDQILDHASQLFGTQGFGATSVSDIADLAGISKPLIYNYFGSKEGLYEACLVRAGSLIADDIDRTAASGEVGLARALVTLDGAFKMLDGRPWIWRLFFDSSRPSTPELDAVIARYVGRLTERAEEGVAELLEIVGDADKLDHSALVAVWAAIFDSLVTWWLDHPEIPAAEMTERSARLMTAIIGTTV